jgi:hypothetical protein
MSRNDKIKLLVIGKNAKSECCKKPKIDSYVLCQHECVNDFWNFVDMVNELGGLTTMEAKKGSDASTQMCFTT